MILRRTFIAAAAMAAALGLSTPASADALADIAARGTIRIAVPQDFPPFGSVGTDMARKATTSTLRT